jgi:hypothetical protein
MPPSPSAAGSPDSPASAGGAARGGGAAAALSLATAGSLRSAYGHDGPDLHRISKLSSYEPLERYSMRHPP